MTLQEIFNVVVMDDEQVSIPFANKKSYDNLRTMLLRKFSRYRQACQEVGIESYNERFISCAFDPITNSAIFKLKWQEDAKRVKKQYATMKL